MTFWCFGGAVESPELFQREFSLLRERYDLQCTVHKQQDAHTRQFRFIPRQNAKKLPSVCVGGGGAKVVYIFPFPTIMIECPCRCVFDDIMT